MEKRLGAGTTGACRAGQRARALRVGLAAIALALLAAAGLSSCATLALRPYNPRRHASVYTAWQPHRGVPEWWYVTGVLGSARKGLWLYQFTIFHEATLVSDGYLLDLALTNYETGRHIFEEYSTTNPRLGYGRNGSIVVGKSSITLTPRRVMINAVGKKLGFRFTLIPEKPPVWEASDGVVGMGYANRSSQRSYYYSFTRLRTSGTVSYLDAAGKRVRKRLAGSSWLDRQWGHFTTSGWDWFSIRLFDGRDIMLYDFPATGFREGTFVGPAGRPRELSRFTYRTDSWQRRGASRYGLSWRIRLPSLGEDFKVVALSRNNFNANKVLPYWEGLCRVYDARGELVGYAVEETTATAHELKAAPDRVTAAAGSVGAPKPTGRQG